MMNWFGFTINGAISKARISLLGFCFILFGLSIMSFKNDTDGKEKKTTTTDSTATNSDKAGFKSLFTGNTYDPTKPYLTQLNPNAVSFVQQYAKKETKEFEKMKVWGRSYFDLYDNILSQYGIPKEMKYLSVIESHLRSGLVSTAGAVGPWQLMDYEAKRFGLKVGRNDGRMDYYKSTHVACKLMRELYTEFNDWLLVVAAYNGGAGAVKRAIRKANNKDFWDLQYYLPEETRNHVKKFIGTHYIFEGGGGLTTMTASEVKLFNENSAINAKKANLNEVELANTATVDVNGKYNSLIIAKNLAVDIAQFNKYNPSFDKKVAAGENYTLRLPKEKLPVFEAKRNQILQESVQMLLSGTVGK
jgi:membrane-bound lytic murein transglycosylase D